MAPDPAFTMSVAADLSDERLARLSRDMLRDLSRAGLDGQPAQSSASPGERGILADVTKLVVERIAGGAVGAVVDCLKAYFAREPSLKISIKRRDGSEFALEARNLDSAEVLQMLHAAERRR